MRECIILLFTALFILGSFSSITTAQSNDLHINEIELNPEGEDSGYEWIELFNGGSSTIDLTGYYLINADDGRYDISGSISGSSYKVITFSKQYLDNTDEGLKLFDNTDNLIDDTSLMEDKPEDWTSGDSRTWSRYPDGSSNWDFKEGTRGKTNGAPNQKPIAGFTLTPSTGIVDENIIKVDASEASDPDNDSLTYEWDWGDGNTGTGKTDSHKYTEKGTYTIKLTVSDGRGGVDSASKKVTIQEPLNKNPVATFTLSPVKGTTATTFQVDASKSTDSDGDTLTFTWKWGDGSITNGIKSSHKYSKIGTYPIELTVSDGKDGLGSINKTVEVTKPDKDEDEPTDTGDILIGCGILITIGIIIIVIIFLVYKRIRKGKMQSEIP